MFFILFLCNLLFFLQVKSITEMTPFPNVIQKIIDAYTPQIWTRLRHMDLWGFERVDAMKIYQDILVLLICDPEAEQTYLLFINDCMLEFDIESVCDHANHGCFVDYFYPNQAGIYALAMNESTIYVCRHFNSPLKSSHCFIYPYTANRIVREDARETHLKKERYRDNHSLQTTGEFLISDAIPEDIQISLRAPYYEHFVYFRMHVNECFSRRMYDGKRHFYVPETNCSRFIRNEHYLFITTKQDGYESIHVYQLTDTKSTFVRSLSFAGYKIEQMEATPDHLWILSYNKKSFVACLEQWQIV